MKEVNLYLTKNRRDEFDGSWTKPPHKSRGYKITGVYPSINITKSTSINVSLFISSRSTYSQVVEGDQSRGELAVEEVMCRVNGAQTGVRVVVGIHAEAEGTVVPQGRCAPVLIVVREAVHLLRQTLLLEARLLDALALLLALSLLLQLASCLACHLLGVCIAVGRDVD